MGRSSSWVVAACLLAVGGCGAPAPSPAGDGGEEAEVAPVCGNGVVESGEDCDERNPVDGDGCDTDCTFSCANDATCANTETCDGAETCDLTGHVCVPGTQAADGTACGGGGTMVCVGGLCVAPSCGDRVVELPEDCDDGNRVDGDGCDADCTFSCAADADCDDANACNGSETCNTTAHRCASGVAPGDGTACDADADPATRDICLGLTCALSQCGDGFADASASEQCDDANLVNGDGCDACGYSCSIDADCADANSCNGTETCDLIAHTCAAGTFSTDGTPCDAGSRVCHGGACALASCGNAALDAGEDCDDANLAGGDGCENDCTFSCTADPTCDDGLFCNGMETCDLAMHRCAGGPAEADGNSCERDGLVSTRDVCIGAVCVASTCGDGWPDAAGGEQCDDGNALRLDGCAPGCRIEQSLRLDQMAMIEPTVGCTDVDSNPDVDNAFGGAFGSLARSSTNATIRDDFAMGNVILLVHLLDLDDPLGQDDPALSATFFRGADAVAPFDGLRGEELWAAAGTVDADRIPFGVLRGGVSAGNLLTGPGVVPLNLSLGGVDIVLDMHRATLRGTVVPDAPLGRIDSITDGLFCGAWTAADLDQLPFPAALATYCPDYTGASILDLLVGGCQVGAATIITPTQPDVDLAGDGIYSPALSDTNGDHVVDTCLDSSTGIAIADDNCAQDPRFDDAYSIALSFNAIRVLITGVAP